MDYLYLLATLLFVWGIKGLTSLRTCKQGNRISEVGMFQLVMAWPEIVGGQPSDDFGAVLRLFRRVIPLNRCFGRGGQAVDQMPPPL